MAADPELPAAQAVGFFSAGQSVARPVLEPVFREEFERLKRSGAHILAVTPLADLADLAFAAEALKAALPLNLLLLTSAEALSQTFPPDARDEVASVLRQASTIEVLHFSISENATAIHLAQRLVDLVSILLVLHEGQAAGHGAEMISYASCRGRTVISLVPSADRIEASRITAAEHPSLQDVATLCALLPTPPEPPSIPTEVLRYFEACDAEATRFAPQVRRYVLNIFLANALASVAGSVSSSFNHSASVGLELTLVKACAILLGLGIYAALQQRESQNRWLRLRLKAEICRSMMATWNSPRVIEPFSADEIPEMGDVFRSLHYFRVAQPPQPKISLEEFKAHYGVRRLAHQYRYFTKQSDSAVRVSKWLKPLYWFFSGGALITSGLAIVVQSVFHPGTWTNFFFVFVPIVAPILASGVLAWQAIESVSRKKVRFLEMKRLMQVALVDLVHSSSWESVHHVVKRAEKVLLSEVLEWYSFVKLK